MRPPPLRRQSPWTREPAVALILVGVVLGVLLAMPSPHRTGLQQACQHLP